MLRIYSDIDGVVANWVQGFSQFIISKHPDIIMDTEYVPGYAFASWIAYKSDKWNVDLTVDELCYLYCEFIKTGKLLSVSVFDIYKVQFQKLTVLLESGEVEFSFITSRCLVDFNPIMRGLLSTHKDYIQECTRQWLYKHDLIRYRYNCQVYFEDKVKFVQQHPCDIFIEDDYDTAKKLVHHVPLVLLVDRSYNRIGTIKEHSCIRVSLEQVWNIIFAVLNF